MRRSPHYWRVTFDRPPLNIFGPETIPQLNEIVTALETDEHVKVVVFDSAVQGFFLTHYDFLAKAQETTSLPTRKWSDSGKCLILNGGDDGTRTRGLCRDRVTTLDNSLKSGGMDSALPPLKAPWGTATGRVVDVQRLLPSNGSDLTKNSPSNVQLDAQRSCPATALAL